MKSFNIFLICLYILLINVLCEDISNISLYQSFRSVVPRGETKTFCLNIENPTTNVFKLLLQQSSIYVGTIGKSDDEFEWYAVKGKSTDDFHNNLKYLIFKLIDENYLTNYNIPDLSSSLIRDLISSCPSPIVANNKFVCKMNFSLLGKPCISVKSNKSKDLAIIINSKIEYNFIYLGLLIFGLLSLYQAHNFSKSEIFQYSFGPLFFVISGLLVIFLFIISHINESRITKMTSSVTILLILFSSYTAGVIYVIRSYFYDILLDNWELTLFYCVTMFLTGIGIVKAIRQRPILKHTLRVSIKWILRIIGLILVYNGSPSPLISMALFAICIIIYIVSSIYKWIKYKTNKNNSKKNK